MEFTAEILHLRDHHFVYLTFIITYLLLCGAWFSFILKNTLYFILVIYVYTVLDIFKWPKTFFSSFSSSTINLFTIRFFCFKIIERIFLLHYEFFNEFFFWFKFVKFFPVNYAYISIYSIRIWLRISMRNYSFAR